MNFELTTAEESSREISKKQSLEAMKEDSEGYSEDFETF